MRALSLPTRIGKRIRAARELRGWTQAELGRRLALKTAIKATSAKVLVSSWETARTPPSTANIIALADTLDVSTDYILDRAQARSTHCYPG